MNIVTDINEMQQLRNGMTQSVGFVATMGNLHDGHMQLCHRARSENDVVIASIFVNPSQFNEKADFTTYPRTLDADIEKLKACGVDVVFSPTDAAMYPDDYQIKLTETGISQPLEGVQRPGHFDGMLTVVMKLLNIIRPQRAYFGEKDYQQYLLVKKMAAAFFLQTDIIGCQTVRHEDGLAMSSRNTRLSATDRVHAGHFPRLLHDTKLQVDEVVSELSRLGFKVEYIEEKWQRRFGAVTLNGVRLIDNIALG